MGGTQFPYSDITAGLGPAQDHDLGFSHKKMASNKSKKRFYSNTDEFNTQQPGHEQLNQKRPGLCWCPRAESQPGSDKGGKSYLG